ncbi:MAG: methyltransferase domain-containing protein [Bacteriovoracaceae bacterium]|nr:methyltransferase domain-containing protein [Bacteriovoracaceae bacterium]
MKEMWNERYQKEEYFYGKNPNRFLESVFGLISEGAQVLTIAEGEGRNAVFLASQGFEVTSVDFSEEGRSKALKLADERKVKLKYELCSLENYEFGEQKWDAVISIFCHMPTQLRQAVHPRIEKSLKERGLFIIQSYNPEQLKNNSGGPKDINMLYTPEILRKDFSALQWIKLEQSVCEIQEGMGHQGLSAVLSGVAFK